MKLTSISRIFAGIKIKDLFLKSMKLILNFQTAMVVDSFDALDPSTLFSGFGSCDIKM